MDKYQREMVEKLGKLNDLMIENKNNKFIFLSTFIQNSGSSTINVALNKLMTATNEDDIRMILFNCNIDPLYKSVLEDIFFKIYRGEKFDLEYYINKQNEPFIVDDKT